MRRNHGGTGAADASRPHLRLGRNYAKLWTASAVSNLGDGIDNAALPLLAEALTRDPVLFAGVAVPYSASGRSGGRCCSPPARPGRWPRASWSTA